MANIYDMRRYGTVVFLLIAVGLAVLFLCISDNIVKKLAEQERQRMEIWADATREIANPDAASDNIDFLLSIIQSNRNIPVLLTDDEGNILDQRNFDLPEPPDTLDPLYISPTNQAFLNNRLNALRNTSKKIVIDIYRAESRSISTTRTAVCCACLATTHISR